jgi:hypothetical protein
MLNFTGMYAFRLLSSLFFSFCLSHGKPLFLHSAPSLPLPSPLFGHCKPQGQQRRFGFCQIALAAGDSTVRIFDRRMLNLRQPMLGLATPTLLSVTPPHLAEGVLLSRLHNGDERSEGRGGPVGSGAAV